MRWGASERLRNNVTTIPSPRPLARREAGISCRQRSVLRREDLGGRTQGTQCTGAVRLFYNN